MLNVYGYCRECEYPLEKLREARCPECGTEFDPDDPKTVHLTRSRLMKFLTAKTSVWIFLPTLMVGCVLMWAIVTPGQRELAGMLMVVEMVALMGTLWVIAARRRFQGWLKRRRGAKWK